MSTLKEMIADPNKRKSVLEDCIRLVDDEVGAKSGLSGIAIKGGYAVVKAIKPGIVRESVDNLLDEFVARLEPYWADFKAQNSSSFERHLDGKRTEVANALLGVTDGRAARAQNKTIKKAYEKLRPTGIKNVEQAVPAIARVIQKHA